MKVLIWWFILIGLPALITCLAVLFYEFKIKKFMKDIEETIDEIENIQYKDY